MSFPPTNLQYQLPGATSGSGQTSRDSRYNSTSNATTNQLNTSQNSLPYVQNTSPMQYQEVRAPNNMYSLPTQVTYDFRQNASEVLSRLSLNDPAIVQVNAKDSGHTPTQNLEEKSYGVRQVPQYSFQEQKQYREVPRYYETQSMPRKMSSSIYVDMPSAYPSQTIPDSKRSSSAGAVGTKTRSSFEKQMSNDPPKASSAGSDGKTLKRVPVSGMKASPLHASHVAEVPKQSSSSSMTSVPRVPVSNVSHYKTSSPHHSSHHTPHQSGHQSTHHSAHQSGYHSTHQSGHHSSHQSSHSSHHHSPYQPSHQQPPQPIYAQPHAPVHSYPRTNSPKPKPIGSEARRGLWPMTPETAAQQLGHILTPFERQEIVNQREVWFAGTPNAEKIGSGKRRSQANLDLNKPDPTTADSSDAADPDGVYNNGFDDARGDYLLTLNDHIGYRYEVIGLLGKGSFGQVVRAFDHRDKREVALKIIRNKRRFEKQGLVECRVLETLKNEDKDDAFNIIHMFEYFHFRGHLCITFELLGVNLYEWLKAGGFKGVTVPIIRRFTTQILRCLYVLEKKKIVHCDLKPENVLLKESAHSQPSYADSNHFHSSQHVQPTSSNSLSSSWYSIKVIDFGSSCFEHEKVYTYVQSRFYRSPEVILGISYNMAIDMWSLGCIMAEMHTGYPLFPGENEQEQLACIMEIKGVPDSDFIERGSRKKLFFDSTGAPRIFANSKGRKRKPGSKQLPVVLRTNDMLFVDFIEKCLQWDPDKRMTPSQALQHEWIRAGMRHDGHQTVGRKPPGSSNPNTPLYVQAQEARKHY